MWDGHIAVAKKRLQPEVQPEDSSSSSSSSSSSIHKNKKNIYREIPPQTEDVKSYCQERSNGINPEMFFDYYQSRGWMIGKNKMKDWKAAIRTWERNNKDNPISNQSSVDAELQEYYRKREQNVGS
jgi:hypothetical protein